MTVEQTTITPDLYTGNGVTLEFPVTFQFQSSSHLVVTRITIATGATEELVLDTDFSMNTDGDAIVFAVAPTSDYKIHIDRDTTIDQKLRLPTLHGVSPELYTNAWDKQCLINQEQARQLLLAVTLPRTTELSGINLPEPAALEVIRWNTDGDGLENVAVSSIGALIISALLTTAVAETTAAGFYEKLGIATAIGTALAGGAGEEILEALVGLSPAANKLPYFTASDAIGLADITAFARTILDDANAAAVLATIGLTDAALTDTAQGWTGPQNYDATAKSGSSGTVTIDLATEPSVVLTLTGDITLAVSNMVHGRGCELKVIQDGTGGRTMGLDTDIDAAGYDVNLNSTASAVTLFWLWTDGTKTFIRKLWEDD